MSLVAEPGELEPHLAGLSFKFGPRLQQAFPGDDFDVFSNSLPIDLCSCLDTFGFLFGVGHQAAGGNARALPQRPHHHQPHEREQQQTGCRYQ